MSLHTKTFILIVAVAVLSIGFSIAALAEDPPESIAVDADETPVSLISEMQRDVEWFAGYPSRAVGQPGHDEAMAELYRRVKQIAGEYVWQHRIPYAAPRYLEANMTLHTGPMEGTHRIYPFWPTGSRLSTTPADGIGGRLVYVGRATIEEFPAQGLKGQIAVLEMANGENWRNVLSFGARALVFLGSRDESNWDTRSHEMVVPVVIPRFYVPEGDLADYLRSQPDASAHIISRGMWQETEGTNIYALVPSKHPEKPGKTVVIAVQSDTIGMVPELAAGADAAVDTAFALNLLKYYAAHPAEHPLLFAFLDGLSLNMKAIRAMCGALIVSPEDREKEGRDFLELLDEYKEYAALTEELRGDPQAIYKLHQQKYRDLHAFIKDEASMEVLDVENRLAPLRLKAYELADGTAEKVRVEHEIDELDKRRIAYNVSRKQMLEGKGQLFAKKLLSWTGVWDSEVSEDGLMQIDGKAIEKAQQLWQRAQMRILGQVADVEKVLEEDRIRNGIQGELFEILNVPPEDGTPLLFVLGIDFSDSGVVVGPQTAGRTLHNQGGSHMIQFIEWLLKVDWEEMATVLPPNTLNALSYQSWTAGDSQNSFVVGENPMVTSVVASYSIPHMSWATLDAYRAKIDTPQDRKDRLNWDRLAPQINLTAEIIRRLVNDPEFEPYPESGAKWSTIAGWVVAQAPGEPMARLPMKGYLTSVTTGVAAGGGMQSGRYNPKWSIYGGAGIRRQEFGFSGWDGYFYIRDLPSNMWTNVATYMLQAHQVAEDGSIISTLDFNSVRRENSFNTHLWSPSDKPLSGSVFPCQEMNAFHFYDPRFLMELGGITVTDARTGNIPKRMNFGMHDGILGGYMESRVRWQVIARIGITSNRFMLLNLQDSIHDPSFRIREASAGFRMNKKPSRHPVHQAAHDMFLLDERRLADYRRAGIENDAIEGMRNRTRGLLDEVSVGLETDNGGKMFFAAAGALANEVRAYRAIRDLGNDVVRAVVFLLLVLIPFSFAMERLLVASPHPYKQLTYTAVIFALMTLLLWSFHPAFRITSQPLIIVMAFGIIFMSIMVVSVIFFKFKSNVEAIKSEYAESSGAQTSRLGLISTAIKLGLANMRKRKLRTALTGATIVLITFAMLCFTSTTTYIGEKDLTLELEKPPEYTGVLLRQPSQRRIRRRAELYLNNIIANLKLPGPDLEADSGPPPLNPKADVAYRYWWLQDPTYRTWRIHVKSPVNGKQISIGAGLGLQANEYRFTGIARHLPNWERFSELELAFEKTQKGGCYLSHEAAESLGIKPGDPLVIGGRDMELVGTFDPLELEEVEDLDGRNMMIIDWGAMPDTQKWESFRGDWDMTRLTTEIQSGEGLTREKSSPYVPASQTVILPASMLRNFGLNSNSHLRTMAIRTASLETARAVAVETGQRMAFPAYYGSPDSGVQILVFVPFLPKAPRSLWILMILAGLIIFNTMMSSIAERKNEIYIYPAWASHHCISGCFSLQKR